MPKASSKASAVLPPPMPNLAAVQNMLAKARATVQACNGKRKGELHETPTPATKPKPCTPVPPAVRVRGKSSDAQPAPAAPPKASLAPPPPKAASKPDPVEGISPVSSKSSCSTPSQRTQEYLLAAKAAREQKACEEKAREQAEELAALTTPPPKHSFASPSETTPPGPLPKVADEKPIKPLDFGKLDSDGDEGWQQWDDWHDSQRSYYGTRGESWWSSGWDYYPQAHSWFWDPWKNRYVFTRGAQSWTSSWSDQELHDRGSRRGDTRDTLLDEVIAPWPETPGSTATLGSSPGETAVVAAANEQNDCVRASLATRKPSVFSPLPDPDQSHESPEAQAPVDPIEPCEPELMHQEGGHPEEPSESAKPAEPASEAWRCDKHGNPCSPAALYMRFYRKLRSVPANYCHGPWSCLH